MALLHPILADIGLATLAIASGYAFLTVFAIVVWRVRPRSHASASRAPVTILKPLCGAEPGLYEDLKSFCVQDYPTFQIVFGVRDHADPARAVAERLLAEFPALPIDIVVNPQLHGSNWKISNLINMLPHARHDILVMADSDALVGRDYLGAVTAPLQDPTVGLVTCLYRGIPTRGTWSRLGAMYINEWYLPSVLLAWLFGHQNYVSGQTMCMRRDTLAAFGGLPALTNHLADDYKLGEFVRELGFRIVLSPYVVTGEHHEPSLDSVTRHEMRWMRTIKVLRPRSFRLLFVTFILPLAIVGLALAGAYAPTSRLAWTLFFATVVARLVLHLMHRLRKERLLFSDMWLIPARDCLIVWIWCRSFFISRVMWRGNEFDVDSDGVMRRLS